MLRHQALYAWGAFCFIGWYICSMKDEDFYKVIRLPHLRFTLYVQDMSKLQGIEIKGAGYTTILESSEDEVKACIFFQDVKEMVKLPQNFPIIAHEVTHIIQLLCEEYSMDIRTEMEHTAYIMHFILEEILK